MVGVVEGKKIEKYYDDGGDAGRLEGWIKNVNGSNKECIRGAPVAAKKQ
jgi:hypothetical protein